MNNIEKFIEYVSNSFSDGFAIFDDNYVCIHNDYFPNDFIKELQKALPQYPEITVSIDKKILVNEIEFDDKAYYLVTCCILDADNKYKDSFLNKITFLFDEVDYGIVILKDFKVVYRNLFLADYLGVDQADKDSDTLFGKLNIESGRSINEFLKNETLLETEVWLKLIDGKETWVTLSKSHYSHLNHDYTVVSLYDFTQKKEIEEKATAEIEYLNRTLESVQDAVIILDKENKIMLFNHNAEDFTGKKKDAVLFKNVFNELYITDSKMNPIRYWEKEYLNQDVVLLTNDGLHRSLRLNVSNINTISGDLIGKVIVLIDITQSKRREEEILYLSYHDVLTGLYNRTFFEEEIIRLNTKRQLPLSIIMGDVNGLKLTNDVFGHIAGDELLRKIADILKIAVRQEDIIARWGGDEFIILLPNTDDEGAQSLMDRINHQFLISENQEQMQGFSPSISLGYGVKKEIEEDIYEVLKVAESNMYKRKMLSKESIYSGVITSMKTALFEKSNETEDHTNRLYDYCLLISSSFDMTKDELNDLEILCMLHDIGKIGIEDNILKKPGPLTPEEWVEMKKHPEIGFRIAQATPELSKVALYILYHHEKFDGTGYPKGLEAYEIPLVNRILSVADAFDAMTHDRTYRKALSKEHAIKELESNKGTQFDPNIVKVFVEGIKKGSSI